MILLTHHTGEPHGILGAQRAATHLTAVLDTPAIVVGVQRDFSRDNLLAFLDDHYQGRARIIGFSHLCGRKDLLELIGLVKERGFFTILGGPQAAVDYAGEPEQDRNPWRFAGLRGAVDLAVQGPVDFLGAEHLHTKGCLRFPWEKRLSLAVDWGNLYTFHDRLRKLDVKRAQVLNAIGCPHAEKKGLLRLPPPAPLKEKVPALAHEGQGCVFCDVARDKGYHGKLEGDAVLSQLVSLPEEEGRKIPCELIDEYPLVSLERILDAAAGAGVELSQIDLVCRVDDITGHREHLREALIAARKQGVRIMFSSIGFESFSDKILQFFHKGITVREIVACVSILRQLKAEFGDGLLYRTDEGARHGFIHPTPWDTSETEAENTMNIAMNRFFEDILPPHSTPLIVHHASSLGDWIRQIESEESVAFRRDGTWIEWWGEPAGV